MNWYSIEENSRRQMAKSAWEKVVIVIEYFIGWPVGGGSGIWYRFRNWER